LSPIARLPEIPKEKTMNKPTRIALAALASLGALAILGFTASPALAVGGPSLPSQDKLFVIECDNTETPLQLFGVDPVAGVATEIGSGDGAETYCGFQGAQMPGTDWFYFFNYSSILQRVDLTTGANETIGAFTLNGSPYFNANSLTVGPDGTAYVLAYDDLFTVDVSTAALTYLSSPNFYDEYSGYPYGFAYDYVTEKFYVVEDGDGALYELVPATGDKVKLTYNGDYNVYSIAFDSEGNLWANGDGNFVNKMALADFGNSAAWQGSADLGFFSESIWVSPVFAAKELPDTGIDATVAVGLAVAFGVAGVTLVAVRRRA
jgi:hypothetical protein